MQEIFNWFGNYTTMSRLNMFSSFSSNICLFSEELEFLFFLNESFQSLLFRLVNLILYSTNVTSYKKCRRVFEKKWTTFWRVVNTCKIYTILLSTLYKLFSFFHLFKIPLFLERQILSFWKWKFGHCIFQKSLIAVRMFIIFCNKLWVFKKMEKNHYT